MLTDEQIAGTHAICVSDTIVFMQPDGRLIGEADGRMVAGPFERNAGASVANKQQNWST